MHAGVRPSRMRRCNFRQRGRYLAMATEVSVDDRFRIQDALRSYVWANDSGSVEAVVAAFTPDGTVQSTGGPIPVRRWASETFAQPGRRGRQHWVQPITFQVTANGVRCAPIGRWCRGLPLPTPGHSTPWASMTISA